VPSFTVRCLFRWPSGESHEPSYEERITLWSAGSADDAIAVAEAEAKSYAAANDVEFLNLCQCYAMPEEVAASGVEVFSLLRNSALNPDDYLRHYFVTGDERELEA
jgi:hypothetical protein